MFTVKIQDAGGARLHEAEEVRIMSPDHTANAEVLANELSKYAGCVAVVRGFTTSKGWVDYPLWSGDRVYVMNANRKTVDQYESKAAAI